MANEDLIWDIKGGPVILGTGPDDAAIDANNPLPTDGDSIYCKDIDSTLSDIGSFTGSICSLFDDYTVKISDVSATTPKTFTIRFKRPIVSNQVAFGSMTSNFSNVKILLKDLAGTLRTTVDDSANDTKYTSNVYPFVKSVFIEMVLEFHTVDTVTISGMFIPKVQSRSISAIDGFVSPTNSTATPLLAGTTFTGTLVDTLNYGMILVSMKADQSSATDGLSVEFSTDGSNWDFNDVFTVAAGVGKTFTFQTTARFLRVVYTNGITDQGYFRLQTTLKPVYVKPSSHRLADAVSGQDDAELVKSGITGQRDDGLFGNCVLDDGNNLRVNSFPYTYAIAEGAISNHTALVKFGTRTAVAAGVDSTVWEGPTARYTYLPSAEQLKVSSTDNVGDNVGGTGALTLVIKGLDSNWLEISETVTMTGTTVVTTTASFLRVFRSYVETCGTSYTNTGTITIKNNAGTVTQVLLVAGDGQTLQTMWTVPAGKTAYMVQGTSSSNTAKGAAVSFFTRMNDGVLFPWQIKYRAFLEGGNEVFPFTIPFRIPEKTDIEVRVKTPGSAGVTSCGATFELWYEDV